MDDPPAEQRERPARSASARRLPVYAGLGAVAGAAIIAGLWAESDAPPKPSRVPVKAADLDKKPVPAVSSVTKPPAERLTAAFEAAIGERAAFSREEGGDIITTTPLRIIDLPFGSALLTKREIKDGCHACTGAIGVYYLKEEAGKTLVIGRWPEAVVGWGWGAAPAQWEVTTRFTSNPAIFASGGGGGQGILMEGATLTELQQSGPVASDPIGLGYSDEDVGVGADGKAPCVVKARIGEIRKDRSFDVIVRGSINEVERYVKRDGRFVSTSTIDWEEPCQP